jgi:glycosyltransferase involved in cell wall biosynthesis
LRSKSPDLRIAAPTEGMWDLVNRQYRGHVCVLTTAHPTDDVRVNSKIVSSLRSAGYRVSWVGPERSQFAGDPRPEPGIDYRLFRPNDTRLRRAGAALVAWHAARAVIDVDWWYSPDPDAAAVAVRVSARQGGRVLFDIHEAFHEGLLDRWFPGPPPPLARELVRRRIARTCRRADLVTGVSRALLDHYLGADDRQTIIRNCAPRFFADDESLRRVAPPVATMSFFHGKAMAYNGTKKVLDAVAGLDDDHARRINVHLTRVAGRDPLGDRLDETLDALRHRESVTLEPGVPHEQMPALLAQCHVGIVSYQRDLGLDSLPNRLFEYMASGLAVLAPSYSPEIVSIVDSEGIGLTADFEDEVDIARAFNWMADHPDDVAEMGARARQAFLDRYNWDAEAAKLVAAMTEVEGQ